jgi:hypothetical protein
VDLDPGIADRADSDCKAEALEQYEKFSTFLRNELVSNNLADFRLKKGLDHLDAVRERFQTITGRFAGFQAQALHEVRRFRRWKITSSRSPNGTLRRRVYEVRPLKSAEAELLSILMALQKN